MSDTDTVESAYDRLARPVQKWIYRQGWRQLREIQEQAIAAISSDRASSGDVIIAAATASGKTEAAFLPLVSRIITRKDRAPGFAALYVSPLKALINDQYRRLESLCEAVDIPVHKWHGDVAQSAKTRARERPEGILLITPESLEALLMRRGNEVNQLVSALDAVVIDELHAFIGSERGVQLQSILHRIDIIAERKIDRIGLSATLGDMKLAAEALRPGHGSTVTILESKESGFNLNAQILGYLDPLGDDEDRDLGRPKGRNKKNKRVALYAGSAGREIAEHLFATMAGKSNLIFAGSRAIVETIADRLREACEQAGVPNEFFAHHGNLSKEHREFVEGRLREDRRPTTAIATSTLELGIDIGDIDTVGQIGAPYTVASLRQRVGRSGRREGQPAILRMYCSELEMQAESQLPSRLRPGLVHAIATLNLLREGWCEPPARQGLHLSTLLHQILAAITQYGGLDAQRLFQLLCRRGAFRPVTPDLFGELLRGMANHKTPLVEQAKDGTILLGRTGERLTSHFSFYAVFQTPEQYKVMADGKVLGRLEVKVIPKVGESIVFIGQRWVVGKIDEDSKTVHLSRSSRGLANFSSSGSPDIHDAVIQEMYRIYNGSDEPRDLDSNARKLLVEARKNFAEVRLGSQPIQPDGDGVLLFPQVGTVRRTALSLALQNYGLHATSVPYCISIVRCSPEEAMSVLQTIAASPPPDPLSLAELVSERILRREKYDRYIPVDLLRRAYAHDRIDAGMLPRLARELVGEGKL